MSDVKLDQPSLENMRSTLVFVGLMLIRLKLSILCCVFCVFVVFSFFLRWQCHLNSFLMSLNITLVNFTSLLQGRTLVFVLFFKSIIYLNQMIEIK